MQATCTVAILAQGTTHGPMRSRRPFVDHSRINSCLAQHVCNKCIHAPSSKSSRSASCWELNFRDHVSVPNDSTHNHFIVPLNMCLRSAVHYSHHQSDHTSSKPERQWCSQLLGLSPSGPLGRRPHACSMKQKKASSCACQLSPEVTAYHSGSLSHH